MSRDALVAHCQELLAPLGPVRARRMFGGWGLYVDEIFIALIAFDRLFLKVDATTRPRLEAAGCTPFRYETRHGEVGVLSYMSAPDEAMESPALMQPWARLALEAALRARRPPQAKPVKRPAKAATKRARRTTAR